MAFVELSVYRPHYIYALVDPRNGQIFYIGVGSVAQQGRRQRLFTHEIRAYKHDKNHNNKKHNKITRIIAAGYDVQYRILFQTDSVQEAFNFEKKLILKLKKHLTNIAAGGIGGVTYKEVHPRKGIPLPSWWVEKLSKAKLGKPSHRKGSTHNPESISKLKISRAKQVMADRIIVPSDTQIKMREMYLNVKNRNAVGRIFGYSKFVTKKVLLKRERKNDA